MKILKVGDIVRYTYNTQDCIGEIVEEARDIHDCVVYLIREVVARFRSQWIAEDDIQCAIFSVKNTIAYTKLNEEHNILKEIKSTGNATAIADAVVNEIARRLNNDYD